MAKTLLYVCTGKHCKDDGSKKTRRALRDLIEKQGLDDTIELDTSNCLGKCGKGPAIQVEPEGVRVKHVDPEKCEQFLAAVQAGTLKQEFEAKKKKKK